MECISNKDVNNGIYLSKKKIYLKNDSNNGYKNNYKNTIKNGGSLDYANINIINNNLKFMPSVDNVNNNYLNIKNGNIYTKSNYENMFKNIKDIINKPQSGGVLQNNDFNFNKVKYKNKKDNYTRYKFVDNYSNEITSGGVLFYKNNNDNRDFLMIKNIDRNKYEDFGGCVDNKDNNVIETIIRELLEESNNVFNKFLNKNDLEKLLINSSKYYNTNNKYLLIIAKLPLSMNSIDLKDFGNKEKHDNINRCVEWVNEDELLSREFRDKLNYRLLFKDFLNYLYKNKKISQLKKNKNLINNSNINNSNINNSNLIKLNKKLNSGEYKIKINNNFVEDININNFLEKINNADSKDKWIDKTKKFHNYWIQITDSFIILIDLFKNQNILFDTNILVDFNNFIKIFKKINKNLENRLNIILLLGKNTNKTNNKLITSNYNEYIINLTEFITYLNNIFKLLHKKDILPKLYKINNVTKTEYYFQYNILDNIKNNLNEIINN